MRRTATFLLALALAASPVAKLVCDARCAAGETGGAAEKTCHGPTAKDGPFLQTAKVDCVTPDASAAVIEAAQHVALSTALSSTPYAGLGMALHVDRHADRFLPGRGSGPSPGSTIDILRI